MEDKLYRSLGDLKLLHVTQILGMRSIYKSLLCLVKIKHIVYEFTLEYKRKRLIIIICTYDHILVIKQLIVLFINTKAM